MRHSRLKHGILARHLTLTHLSMYVMRGQRNRIECSVRLMAQRRKATTRYSSAKWTLDLTFDARATGALMRDCRYGVVGVVVCIRESRHASWVIGNQAIHGRRQASHAKSGTNWFAAEWTVAYQQVTQVCVS